ncbi:MAG: hypothetical protein OK456_08875 [Thaumarchaeota archaeon]|nr:hypothetical protein [Nitrososphaerota archaeon]
MLWMSASEKSERERVAIQKEAISTLEKAVEEYGRDLAHKSLLTCTVRRWRGIVAREEGNWASARFEFLQGRSLAESYDASNVPWFDAAIAEAEIWEAFEMPGLKLDGLIELVEKLDRTSDLYGMAGDRSNVESTDKWAEWFRFFLVPTAPAPALVARIADEVKRLNPKVGSGETAMQSPFGDYVFNWNYFWFSALARQIEAHLREILGATSNLEELVRGASFLARPTRDLEPLLKPYTYRRDERPVPESPEQLSARIRSDLDAFRAVEKDAKEYASKVRELWDSSTHQKRREVEHAMHPGKKRW